MKLKASPAIVGAFALGACALAVAALIFFGGVNLFHRPLRFAVYFNESIQGLNLGSPVKLRGVGVGRVVGLNVQYDQASNGSAVVVVCEFDRNMITDDTGAVIDVTTPAELGSLVNHGLRAQLGVLGLATGLLYVELDFLDPKIYPAPPGVREPGLPEVPAIPSTISEFQASVTQILTRIQRIDFEGIAGDFRKLIDDAKVKVDGADLAGLTAQWKKAAASVDSLANSPQLKDILTNLGPVIADVHQALLQFHTTLANVDMQVGGNGQALQDTLKNVQDSMREFSAAALTLRRFIDSQQNLGGDAHEALTQLAAAAASVERLADFLERNPNALISGRKQEP